MKSIVHQYVKIRNDSIDICVVFLQRGVSAWVALLVLVAGAIATEIDQALLQEALTEGFRKAGEMRDFETILGEHFTSCKNLWNRKAFFSYNREAILRYYIQTKERD